MTGSPAKFAGEIISGSSDYVDYNQNNGGQDFLEIQFQIHLLPILVLTTVMSYWEK